MQDKATRASWRAAIVLLIVPLVGASVTYWRYREWQADTFSIENLFLTAGVSAAAAFLIAPLVLWWSVSAVRRGTRRMVLSLVTGFVSGAMTALLAAGVYAAAVGYTLVTGDPIPYLDITVPAPGGIR